MRLLIYIISTLLFCASGSQAVAIAQGAPDHLFKDDEPHRIQVNVLIVDERKGVDEANTNYVTVLRNYMKQELPFVNFVFATQMSELKRSGDYINIIVTVKESGLTEIDNVKSALTHYYVTIYDVSKTPIFIKDGNVKYDYRVAEDASWSDVAEKTIDVANQRLIAFLKRSITHKSFHR
ncbi:MAG: hypothetical protein PF489_13810 [Salinivirgaceae bacterium]|jgi:hypothetical protein|nr:hypothetical protein [Salinivirgaceae bacterium]